MVHPNEWAPVHGGITGPGHSVLAEIFWYTPVMSQNCVALGLRASSPAFMFEFSAALDGMSSCSHLASRRDPAVEQGRWLLPGGVMAPLLEWPGGLSSASAVCGSTTSSDRNSCEGGSRCSRNLEQVQHAQMLRQMRTGVKNFNETVPSDRAGRNMRGKDYAFAAALFASTFALALPLPSSISASRTFANSSSEALSTRGKRRFNSSSAATITDPITTRANHL